MKLKAFTLVELTVVVAILGIVSSIVVLSVRGHLEQARLESVLDRVEALDGRLRAMARRQHKPCTLLIVPRDGQLRDARLVTAGRQVTLRRGLRIDRLRTARYRGEAAELRIGISSEGYSDSYAIRFRTASGDRRWLVFLGASGQCLRLELDREVEEFFATMASAPLRVNAG